MIDWLVCRWLGVDHIYLTENNSDFPVKDGIQAYIDEGYVTYTVDPTPYPQMKAHEACLINYRTEYNWMAFIDADELIVVREPCDFTNVCYVTHISIGTMVNMHCAKRPI